MEAKKRVLCLHGWRTSAKIMNMQTASMQWHVPLEFCFLDAPFPAEGPPVAGIRAFYPNQNYFEWIRKDAQLKPIEEDVNVSVNALIQFLLINGPFEGVLGFSQGAAVATRLAYLQCQNDYRFKGRPLFNFLILIGGVEPFELNKQDCDIKIPSLHIMGKADPLFEESISLVDYFCVSKTTTICHDEGHNIPSLHSGIYPKIATWLEGV